MSSPRLYIHIARSLLERTGENANYAIQKKIVVSDVLQGLPREEPKRFENARYVPSGACIRLEKGILILNIYFRCDSGERLQDIVICASLLDRLPNLAGMARTCEVRARVSNQSHYQGLTHSSFIS